MFFVFLKYQPPKDRNRTATDKKEKNTAPELGIFSTRTEQRKTDAKREKHQTSYIQVTSKGVNFFKWHIFQAVFLNICILMAVWAAAAAAQMSNSELRWVSILDDWRYWSRMTWAVCYWAVVYKPFRVQSIGIDWWDDDQWVMMTQVDKYAKGWMEDAPVWLHTRTMYLRSVCWWKVLYRGQ